MKKLNYTIKLTTLLVFGWLSLYGQDQLVAYKNNSGINEPSALDAFYWLPGHWIGNGFGGISEEIWLPVSGGTMMGMYRHIMDDKINFYEFLIIVEEEDGIKLKIKHFNPDFTGWEEKDKFIEFPFLKATENELVFDGLVFKRVSEDKMDITLKINRKGEISTEVFNFSRSK